MTTVYVTHPRYTEHDLAAHPEHAGRIRAIWRHLDDTGLTARMLPITAEAVTDEQILTAHTPTYLELLYQTSKLARTVRIDTDTYATPASFEVARLAAGAVAMAVAAVLRGEASNGLAAIRPPGHHALPEIAMGFCLLGNVAIAARHAHRTFGVGRVLIVDYDVHHGNGTEAIFYDDPSVLFISIHQSITAYGSPFYPGTGHLEDIGEGRGTGLTLNIPLPPGHSDASYDRIFHQVVLPAARRFQPELILVSAGFDAHWIDPLAGMRLTLTGYTHLARWLVELAQDICRGRIVFATEGGYNLDVLSQGVANTARVLLGDADTPDMLGPPDDGTTEPDVQPLIARLRRLHKLE